VFDFEGLDTVGQSFADEIFRVFPLQHPDIDLIPINMSKGVEQMIRRAKLEALTNPLNTLSSPELPGKQLG
jgi:hypothetical protein